MDHCCFIPDEPGDPCDQPAEWVIIFGPAPTDHTEACTDHVGHLLTDADEHRVYPHPQTIEVEGK